jgi:hypothetical protein
MKSKKIELLRDDDLQANFLRQRLNAMKSEKSALSRDEKSKKIVLLRHGDSGNIVLSRREDSAKIVPSCSEDDDESQQYEPIVADILLELIQGAKKYYSDRAGMRDYMGEWKWRVKRALAECARVEEDDRDYLFLDIITRYTPT